MIRGLARRRDQRRADDDRRVLAALRHSPPAGEYDIEYRTGLRSVRIFRALSRLEDAGLVVGEFEDVAPLGRPARRLYRVARMGEMTLRPQSAFPYPEERP